jgi:ATP-binding cassette subfamily F protein 3
VHDGSVEDFPLSLDDYPKWLSEQGKQGMVEGAAPDRPEERTHSAEARRDRKREEAELRKRLQPLRKRVTDAEARLERLHAALEELNARLADPAIYEERNKPELQQCLLEKADLDRQCGAAEEEWMAAAEELEKQDRLDT